MTSRPAAPRTARLRTITIAGIAGICTVLGPLAVSASAAADPALSLGASSVRPGVPFTVSAATGCPSGSGMQTVDFSFTDKEGTYSSLGSIRTGDDGSWATTSLTLPVVGVDEDGGWQGDPIASGPGTLEATCSAADDSGDDLDSQGLSVSVGAGHNDDNSDDDGDSGDDGDELGGTITQTYASATLSVSGTAPQLSVSPAVAKPGGTVTVTPSGACPTGSAASAHLSVVQLGATGDDGDDDGDDVGTGVGDDSTTGGGSVADATVTTSSTGTWAPVSIALPADADTGDYAVTADCVVSGKVAGSYDAAPIALGSVAVAKPNCSGDGAAVALSGSYSGDVAVSTAKRQLSLPAKLALRGNGPWTVAVSSATTGLSLATANVSCPKPSFDLDVPKTSVGSTGKLRANVCNTGKKSVSAILQVVSGGRFKAVDDDKLAPGDCSWLTGGKLAKGDSVRARVLLDAPGSSSDEVSASFTARRPRR